MNDGPPTRGASNLDDHGWTRELLAGVLAGDGPKVYPDDKCLECEREGKVAADERCFHRHWAVADSSNAREYRGHGVR